MNLSGLLPLIRDMPAYRSLIKGLQEGGEQRAFVIGSARPYLLACLHCDLSLPTLVITAGAQRAKRVYDELLAWCPPTASVQLFPAPDALPYEHLASDALTIQQRLRILSTLSQRDKAAIPLIVASTHAVIQKTVSPTSFASACHTIRKGIRLSPEPMLAKWMSMGYELESAVAAPGTLSRRGGIIDIYPPHADLPARIELLGNEVESIRLFDPSTQRSLEPVPAVTIVPAKEMLIPEQAGSILQALDLLTLSARPRERMELEMAQLLGGKQFDNLEFYAALFNQSALPDHLPPQSLVVIDQPGLIETEVADLEAQAIELRGEQVGRQEMPPNFPVPYFTWLELVTRLSRIDHRLSLEAWGDESQHQLSFGPAPSYSGRLQALLKEAKEMLAGGSRLVIVSQQAARLSELLQEQELIASPQTGVEYPPQPGATMLVQGSLAEGWTMDSGAEAERAEGHPGAFILLTDAEVFGFAKLRRTVPRRPMRHEVLLSDLAPGDYVVHVEHGIGRFCGLTKMPFDGGEREYLILEYAAGDRLYVPSDQIDRVGRYIGPGGYAPKLSYLGTQEWTRTKEKVKGAAASLAKELLALYSLREVSPGFAFAADSAWEQELEASFPYVETPDQLKAVYEVKQDMQRPRPMDRLACGDVGYGKTEVAIRAAFKAVMNGMQAAVLVPTTVLAQQHFTTFNQRLGAFPVRVEVLSRFRSPREQSEILEGLKNGSVDICIGTHRLLQRDVSFHNLGLVIIDEEQRFGVAHKEKLKQMRREVHVLTLSATPIPRTLHMSLVGVRDMSIIETPPEERLPIKTYISEYDDKLIRETILRELDRNGQVFFVHNRVQNIHWVAETLASLVPEARIAVAHGQMPEETLESVMLDFSRGQSDVLVCTTIIESGLDLPNVNTLIINDADKLGLTQLYQLRGRVGRGISRAYAYFLVGKGKRLTEAARKRLKTIFEATELGAGFRIAMKDLEIRGAGNLLGSEQSGHMGAVGFELYCQLLAESVDELKVREGQKPPTTSLPTPTIDLPLAAYIPEEYVPDLSTRLALYRRLAMVDSPEKVEGFEKELGDRFGPPPPPAKNLLYVVQIRVLGAQARVQSISREGPQLVLRVGKRIKIDRDSPVATFGDRVKVGTTQLRLDLKRLEEKWQEVLIEIMQKMARAPKDDP